MKNNHLYQMPHQQSLGCWPTRNPPRVSVSQAKRAKQEKRERDELIDGGGAKEMDEEKWVQLVPFVAVVDGPRSFRSTGRAQKAPVMTC